MSKHKELALVVIRKVFDADGHELTTDEAAAVVDAVLDALAEPSEGQLSAAQTAWLDDPQRRSSTIYRAMIKAARDGK